MKISYKWANFGTVIYNKKKPRFCLHSARSPLLRYKHPALHQLQFRHLYNPALQNNQVLSLLVYKPTSVLNQLHIWPRRTSSDVLGSGSYFGLYVDWPDIWFGTGYLVSRYLEMYGPTTELWIPLLLSPYVLWTKLCTARYDNQPKEIILVRRYLSILFSRFSPKLTKLHWALRYSVNQ